MPLYSLLVTCVCIDTAAVSATAAGDLSARYEQLKTERRCLPVHRARGSLLQRLRQLYDSTAVIIGETGSGKTTQIPQVFFVFLLIDLSEVTSLYFSVNEQASCIIK